MHFPYLVFQSCALWAIGHVGHPFAKFVLSVPEVLAMLRVPGWRHLAIYGRRRRGRRLTNRDLANPRHPNLNLRVS